VACLLETDYRRTLEGRRLATTRPKLKVAFFDFWENYQPANSYFHRVLSTRFTVEIDQSRPDIALFSVFGEQHRSVSCKKYHFTGETRKAPAGSYDYSFTFDPTGGVNYRLPLWVMYIDWFGAPTSSGGNPAHLIPLDALSARPPPDRKPLFCNFIYNNDSGARVSFLEALKKRREVDCLGALRNNREHLGGDELTKIEAQRRYRFSIAFENTISPGYVTEKILHPLAAQSLPIYCGCL